MSDIKPYFNVENKSLDLKSCLFHKGGSVLDLALILQGVIWSEERRRPASLKGNLALRCIPYSLVATFCTLII